MATAEHTISPGGLARNADGTLADMPRDTAHVINAELLRVVALLQCGRKEIQMGSNEDADDMHDPSSRAVSLSVVAEEKIRDVIQTLSPYV